MSLDEILLIIDTFRDRKYQEMKSKASDMYTISTMIAAFVNSSLQGKAFPKKYECFPGIEDFRKEEKQRVTNQYKDRFKAMAQGKS